MSDLCATLARPILALAIAVALAVPASAWAQASASGQLQSSTSQCPGGGFAVPAGSPSSLAAIIEFAGAQCQLHAGGFAYAGVVGAGAHVNSQTGGVGSVFQRADASGGWSDGLQVVWPERFSVTGLDHLRLNFNVGAHGSVSANQIQVSPTFGTGSAEIGYTFNFAGVVFQGSERVAGNEGVIPGPGNGFGTLAGSVDLGARPNPNADGTYSFSDISIALSGYAHALVQSESFTPNGPDLFANADFGSTLQWKGVVGVQAFDSAGNQIALPAGFEVGLIGGQTGLNYWNEAPLVAVPEPATYAMLLAGLGWVAGAARGRARREKML